MKKRITFLDFRDFFLPLGYVSLHQANIWDKRFDRNNFRRWEKQGKLLKLRQGVYTFPSLQSNGDAFLYFSNKIYTPSYISLESAFSFYGMIPESVVQCLAVTSRKTKQFTNPFGHYVYRTVKAELMFGYTPLESRLSRDWSILMAYPEKALLDFLYLNPQYDTRSSMRDLRLDIEFMQEELNLERFDRYVERFGSKTLARRAGLLKREYI